MVVCVGSWVLPGLPCPVCVTRTCPETCTQIGRCTEFLLCRVLHTITTDQSMDDADDPAVGPTACRLAGAWCLEDTALCTAASSTRSNILLHHAHWAPRSSNNSELVQSSGGHVATNSAWCYDGQTSARKGTWMGSYALCEGVVAKGAAQNMHIAGVYGECGVN